MKKIASIIFAAALLLGIVSFSGCADKPDAPVSPTSPVASATDSGEHKPGDRYQSTVTVEGVEEPVLVELLQCDDARFTIEWYYADFTHTSSDGYETFEWVHDDETQLSPENLISISRQDYDANSIADQCENMASRDFDCVERIDTTLGQYDAILLAATNPRDGVYSDGTVHEFYVLKGDAGNYLVEVYYNVGAAEGVYARMKSMLSTLELQ